VNPAQQVDQPPAVLLGKIGEGLAPNLGRQVEDAGEKRARLFGQHQPARATVGRVGAPLDPTILFHPVDLPDQGHRLDLEQIRKSRLIDALMTGEVAQNPALRPGEAEKQQCPLIKAPREEPRDVVDEIAEAAVDVHRWGQKKYPYVIISYDTKIWEAAIVLIARLVGANSIARPSPQIPRQISRLGGLVNCRVPERSARPACEAAGAPAEAMGS